MDRIILSKKSTEVWLNNLPNKIYKILPIYETESDENFKKYVNKLIIRASKFNDICDGLLSDIIFDLMYLIEDDRSHAEVRKIILDDTELSNRIIDKYV